MKTVKPISSVTWNTEEFLQKKLKELTDNHTISFWFYVFHLPESNEKKEHFHIYLEPDCRVDTNDIRVHFEEVPKDSKEKDIIRPLPFEKSNFDNAYLYFIHNKLYLNSKGLSKQYYNYTDVKTSDEFLLQEKIGLIDYYKLQGSRVMRIREAIAHGITFEEMVSTSLIPVQQINQYERLYKILRYEIFEKNLDNN
mgnify:CR=1 FL=1